MELRRVKKEEIEASQHWDLFAVAEAERARIVKWLSERANENLKSPNATEESALAAAPTLESEVGGFFAIPEEIQDPELIERGATGGFARDAPTLGWIKFTNFMRWALFALELGVFGGLWLLGGAHPAVIIPGAILGFGGLLLGMGFGREFERLASEENRNREPRAINILAILFGILAIGGVTFVRVRLGEEEGLTLGIITLVLALMIAFFEAAYEYGKEHYERLRDKMYLAQLWTATKRHKADTEQGFWQRRYSQEVRRIVGAVRKAHAPIFEENPEEFDEGGSNA